MKILTQIKILRLDILISITLLALYLITRLLNLKILPIFTDEAIYSYWSQVALNDPENRFISLIDGKQPLFIWIGALYQALFKDPLVAMRLVSVTSGLFSTVGLFFLSKELFSKKVGYIASFLYIILPFTLLYDRMALFDSFLTMLGIWAIFFSIKLGKEVRLDWALITGSLIGFAQITKSSGNFFLYFLPFTLVFFNFKKSKKLQFIRLLFLFALVFVISLVIYNSLRLSPFFYIIARKNLEFIRSFQEVWDKPFEYSVSNFNAIVAWLKTYMGIPLFILWPASVGWAIFKKNKSAIYLTILFAIPLLAEVFFNKVLYPRFMLFYFPFIIILIAFLSLEFLEKFSKYKKILWVLLIIFCIQPIINSYYLITNPLKANIPDAEVFQYRDDWPAGYGVEDVIEILKRESQNDKIYIGTEGTFGLYPFALNIYFFKNDNVHISSYWPVDSNLIPKEIIDYSKNNKTYFIFNESQKEITNPQLKLVTKYKKGNGNSYMRLYEVNPR